MEKKKKILILVLIFVGLTIALIVLCNKSINSFKNLNELINKQHILCNNIVENNDYQNELYDVCKKNVEEYSPDNYNNFFAILTDIKMHYFSIVAIILIFLVMSLSSIWVIKVFKNNYVSNYYLRGNNTKFFKTLIKECYIYILPIILAFIVFFIYLLFRTNFDPTNNFIIWQSTTMSKPYLFIILYLCQLFLFLGIFANFSLITARKNNNYLIALILSILLFLGVELFAELILSQLLNFKYAGYFMIADIFYFDDTYGLFAPLIFPLFLFTLTSIIIYLLYRNKEKMYLDSEAKR